MIGTASTITPDPAFRGLAAVDSATAGAPAKPALSIVLAVLNERAALPQLLDRLGQVPLPEYEIIIVDDGSRDGTREYVQQIAASDPRIRVLLNGEARTLIPAQSEGIEAARGDFVIIMDSDLQHPPEKIPELYRELTSGAGIVLASRYLRTGSTGRRPWTRGIMSRGAELILRLVLPETRAVSDPLSGFYGFRRTLFRRPVPMHLGYHMLPYMLISCTGSTIREVPYTFGKRLTGTSKITKDYGFIPLFLRQVRTTSRIRRALARARAPPRRYSREPIRSRVATTATRTAGTGASEEN
jgi:dolichol-phosphate mannosyltransferase